MKIAAFARPAAALAGAAALGLTALTATTAHAATTERVTEASVTRAPENTPPTDSWMLYTRLAGAGQFVTGPASPPLGSGSLELTTPTGADKVFLFNYDHVGTKLTEIDAISYSTYRTAGQAQQVTALNLQIDYNGPADGGFSTLIFEPVYNTDQGAVVDGAWQDWDALSGDEAIWWSSRDIPGVCAFTCYVAWDDILAANPDATILGGVGPNQGSGNPGLTASVDAFTFDETTYDFEPLGGEDCKNGGWQSFSNPSFKNQGECVSYFARRK